MGLLPNKRIIPKDAIVLSGAISTGSDAVRFEIQDNSQSIGGEDTGFTISLRRDSIIKWATSQNILLMDLFQKLEDLETSTGKVFGDAINSLLLGITVIRGNMPSKAVEAISYIGLGDSTIPGLCITSDPRKVYEAYCRLIMHYAQSVIGTSTCRSAHTSKVMVDRMENRLNQWKARKGYQSDEELTASDWANLAGTFKAMIQVSCGRPFPEDPRTQLQQIVEALMQQPTVYASSGMIEQQSNMPGHDIIQVHGMSL